MRARGSVGARGIPSSGRSSRRRRFDGPAAFAAANGEGFTGDVGGVGGGGGGGLESDSDSYTSQPNGQSGTPADPSTYSSSGLCGGMSSNGISGDLFSVRPHAGEREPLLSDALGFPNDSPSSDRSLTGSEQVCEPEAACGSDSVEGTGEAASSRDIERE